MRHKINAEGMCSDCWQFHSHHPLCKSQTVAGKAAQVDWLFRQNEQKEKVIKRLRNDVTFWQGKYHLVKNENNALKKKGHPQ